MRDLDMIEQNKSKSNDEYIELAMPKVETDIQTHDNTIRDLRSDDISSNHSKKLSQHNSMIATSSRVANNECE